MKTLYLYGPPASGKSTLAARLSRETGRMSLDLDEEIVRREGRSIPQIFAEEGEAGFRRIESETLRAIQAPIIALGGGTLLDPVNRAWAEEHGMVAVLSVSDEVIAARIEQQKGTRPLGNKLAERRAHYASFPHQITADTRILLPRLLRGRIQPPVSKSHVHRLLIATFLAGGDETAYPLHETEADDIRATRRCIAALRQAQAAKATMVTLDCGESGSTLRFFAPLAAALGFKATFVRRGRLAERPMITYETLEPGLFEMRGDVSSQFVTGLLFALPLLAGDSEIRFSTPLQSRGYVDLTCAVLRRFGVVVTETATGFTVKGSQTYTKPEGIEPERDWSGAAFWYAANALGSTIQIAGLSADSCQPDRVVPELVDRIVTANREERTDVIIDVSGCPDNYPALAVVNFALGGRVTFSGTERLKIKESDRLAAMEEVFASRNDVTPRGDHRIAMAAAILSTVSDGPTFIHQASCVNKSYPGFFDHFQLEEYAVTGWPLKATRSPELHNAAHAAAGTAAEMIAYPAPTIEEALAFAARCDVKGMAVTIPHKESVIPYLKTIHPAAASIGAVNTLVFTSEGIAGYNTDAEGVREALVHFTERDSFAGLKVVLLGAGGAAKAVAWALHDLGAHVAILNRSREKAVALAEKYGFEVLDAMRPADLIVNATNTDPIPDWTFSGQEFVYDLVYMPAETPLIVHARCFGCRVENGFSMLQAQAKRQLEIFAEARQKRMNEPCE